MNVIKARCSCRVIILIVGGLALIGFGIFGGWRTTSLAADIRYSERNLEHSRQIGLIQEFVGNLDSGFAVLEDNLRTINEGIGGGTADLRQLVTRLQNIAATVAAMENEILYRRGSVDRFMRYDLGIAVDEVGEM